MRVHPIANLFPELLKEELTHLAARIKANGLRHPIVLLDGKILDGRNRWKACKIAKVEPRFKEYKGSDPLGFVVDENLARRHLSETQRAEIASRIANMPAHRPNKSANLRASQASAAKQLNVSPRSVQNIEKIKREAPDLVPELQKGTLTTHAAIKEVEDRKQKPRESSQWITLDHWAAMSKEKQMSTLDCFDKTARFNRQESDEIEWAKWSWNPVTGCEFGCVYCYARDIALKWYPKEIGFKPALVPKMIGAPIAMKSPPDKSKDNIGWRNVFVCSMSDLFGNWVPMEWIDAVLNMANAAPEWNFLFLTKNPKRLKSIEFGANCWVGTTVDRQARVKPAEDAFSEINASVRFLSCEPLSEPLKFKKIEVFDWIIVGGASPSKETESWQPPRQWVDSIHKQADKAGVPVYEKTNLITPTSWKAGLSRKRHYPGVLSVSIIKKAPWEL